VIRIGTAGYSYPGPPPQGWHGVFYPKINRRGFDELEYYSRFFNAVEINSTFYRPPEPGMAEAWVRKTPKNFEFAVKAWQKFTHTKKIGNENRGEERGWEPPTDQDVEVFKKGIGPLADAVKLGMLLFQYPPSFHKTTRNVELLGWTLRAFGDYPKEVGLRHQSGSDSGNQTTALLKESAASWAVIDEPKFASSVKQEFAPVGKILYLRLHGRNQQKWWRHNEAWERYDYCYGPEEIRYFGDTVKEVAKNSPCAKIYVVFNNHARGQAVTNSLMLMHEVEQRIGAALPRTLVEAYPQLAEFANVAAEETLF